MTTPLRHVDHPDDERFDSVTIDCVERWKESDLSGDEWRFEYRVRFYRKGHVIIERSFSRMHQALAYLPSLPMSTGGKDFNTAAWKLSQQLCDQPGCSSEPVVFYLRKRRYSTGGYELKREGGDEYRQFCARHKNRGDCALDDAEQNYDEILDPRGDTP